MASNSFGKIFRYTTFGESHGPEIGCVIDGVPPGIKLTKEDIQSDLNRRKPGSSKFVTQRKEKDIVKISSGVFEGITTGTPIALLIQNEIFFDLGGFDNRFFATFEDVDLSWRSWIFGYNVVVAPKSIVYHLGGQTIKKIKSEIIEHKNFIGGRFSVLSEAGMLPAQLMGLKEAKFKRFNYLINNKEFEKSLVKNVAATLNLIKEKKNLSIILNYDKNSENIFYWYQQLIAESLGKKGKGIYPSLSFAPKDHHSLLQLYLDGPKDKFFTFFSSLNERKKHIVSGKIIPNSMGFLKNRRLGFIIKAQCNATKNIFKLRNIPFRHFVFNKRNEEELGMIFTFFVLETILLARLMNINPFNQPAVEQVKIETRKILSR